jgi:putative flippase GtrA
MIKLIENKISILLKLFNYEAGRFLIIGFITVFLDLLVYFLLINLSVETLFSKGISFSIGAIFAYFANRTYTFKSTIKGFLRFVTFLILYLSTLILNVSSNEIILSLLSNDNFALIFAFVIATSLSAVLNFVGMKYVVFYELNGQ